MNDLRKEIGMVFQKPNPFPMSVYDNIAYGPRTHGIKNKIQLDDIVDDAFDRTKNTLIHMISSNREDGQYCLDLLMIAKYLERIGDHATNIAEWVAFSITGNHAKVD